MTATVTQPVAPDQQELTPQDATMHSPPLQKEHEEHSAMGEPPPLQLVAVPSEVPVRYPPSAGPFGFDVTGGNYIRQHPDHRQYYMMSEYYVVDKHKKHQTQKILNTFCDQ